MSEGEILIRFIYNIQVELINNKMGLVLAALYPYPKTDSISVQTFGNDCDETYCKCKALELRKINEYKGFYGLGAIKAKNVIDLGLMVKDSRSEKNPFHADILIGQKHQPHEPLPQKIIQQLDALANRFRLFKEKIQGHMLFCLHRTSPKAGMLSVHWHTLFEDEKSVSIFLFLKII